MKHLKTLQELNEASENLNISGVSESNSLIKKCKFCGYDIKLDKFLDMWVNIHADKSKEKRNPNRFSYDMYCIINGKHRRHLPE